LAIVLFDDQERVDGPYYLQNPFTHEPDFGVASVNYELKDWLARSVRYQLT
jgi:hypothetical protein